MHKLGEGAEAKIFETRMFGEEVIVKFRQEKKYRIKELDKALRKARTKKEARLMHKTYEYGVNTPRIIAIGKFSIYMEKLKGKLLRDSKTSKEIYGEVGKLLAKMHSINVVHGDFTPANIIWDGSKLYIIDFGLSDESNSIEEKAIDLLLMKRSISRDFYAKFERSYARESYKARETLARLAEIEKRGRYQVRTLMYH